MRPDKKRPSRDGQSRSGALATADRRILQTLLDTNAPQAYLTPAFDDPYAVAVSDGPWNDVQDARVRRYRNRPSAGRLEFWDPVSDEVIELSNLTILLSGDLDRLCDPSAVLHVVGCRCGDIQTGRSFTISAARFVCLSWVKRQFGSDAWYRADLRGHVIEGWVACSVAQRPEYRGHGVA